MFLALDIGNSSISCALFLREDPEHSCDSFSIPSSEQACTLLPKQIAERLRAAGFDPKAPLPVGVASVVPALRKPVEQLLRTAFSCDPHWISHESDFDMPIDLEIPEQIGADRLVNAAYAKHRYGSPVVVVDFGTATSFDVVSRSGRFIGGAIAPGLELSASALSARAAQLPEFKLAAPKRAIGRNTLEALESGAIFCHAGGVDRLVSQIQSELEERPLVIATGGLLSHIKAYAASLDVVAPDLTLQGVRWITERNSPTNSHR